MAVEYDISSDVAVIKETGSVSQCARVTQMYSGQITYDDEAGSKFATATINGKSQRVMLCIAVSGTVTYDDVPSLYSTVDGHRCLNIVTPTETGTPDDVPSLYETVVIDGQNVRAVRCIMINKTPVYDGVSSTCTFTGDDGKTHTAQLVNKVTGGSVQVIIKGTSPLVLPDAIANSLSYVKAFGGTEQNGTPTPDAPVDIVSNNGVLKLGYTSRNLNVGTLDNQGYTSTGGTSTSTTFCGTLWKIKVQEGEGYTVSFGNFPDGVSGVFINTWKTDGTWNSRQAISISGDYTYTIPAGVGEVNFTLYKTGGITIGSNSWLQVEKGETATPYVPAGYGLYVDGTTETINAHGKNLLPPANIEENIATYYTDFPTNGRVGYHLSLKAGTYTYSVGSEESTTYLRYKYNGQEWSAYASIRNNGTTQTYTNDVEIAIYSGSSGNNIENMLGRNVQVELGSTATEYAPYYDGGTATAEMLLKVGDYQDEQEILSGAVTRNVGVKVFDGTENWQNISGYMNISKTDLGTDSTVLPNNSTNIICSHFETKTGAFVDGIGVGGSYVNFKYDSLFTTLAQFKQWLADQYAAGTPVIVIYPLATPTTESVAGQTLQVTDGDNTLEITQASLDGLELEVEYQAAVSLTIQEVEDANLDNNVTVTIQ